MRPIDADALMREFAKFVKASNNSDFAKVPTWNDAVSLLGSAPTITMGGMTPTSADILGVISAKLELLRDDIDNYCCDEQWISPVTFDNLLNDVDTILDLITGIYAAENAEEVKRGQDSTV